VTSWNTVPGERKSSYHFHVFVFLGVHFAAFGALEHVMNAVSGMSCLPAVMYSVCKPDISETSKSEPVYALLAIISSEHTQQRIFRVNSPR
jgi:hypothetical protein